MNGKENIAQPTTRKNCRIKCHRTSGNDEKEPWRDEELLLLYTSRSNFVFFNVKRKTSPNLSRPTQSCKMSISTTCVGFKTKIHEILGSAHKSLKQIHRKPNEDVNC